MKTEVYYEIQQCSKDNPEWHYAYSDRLVVLVPRIKLLRKKFPSKLFRIVRLTIVRFTEEVIVKKRKKKYTDSQLDPLSDEYIGHTKALKYGVKCCCDRSKIDCPYHGR